MSIIRKLPIKIRVIILISYCLPFFIQDHFSAQGMGDLRWFFYLVPVFFFAYYFGLRGGLICSFVSNSFYLLWEWGETRLHFVQHRPEWQTYLLVSISLVSFAVAAGIGLLANKLGKLSVTDALTGLYNRRFIDEYRIHPKGAVIFFIDLDRFKVINDSLGHRIGDQVLQAVSMRLKEQLGKSGVIARLGGDEFVSVFYETELTLIKRKAADLLKALSAPFLIEGNELYLSASIGISLACGHNEDLSSLIGMADAAMYRAKQQGKNQYRFYAKEMGTESLERIEMEKDLHKALDKGEFVLYYQPRFDLKTNMMIGMEALIRWQHPNQGMITPDRFIPIAEETGLIVPLGEWVLFEACRQNKRWQDGGYSPLRVSVNISPRQFQTDLAAGVKKVLEQTGMDPKWLELEITESMLMKDVEEAVHTLQQLKDSGVYLSIDDFGTGYSSLNYLRLFPIDCLKIDKSFVQDAAMELSIPKAIISLGHSLNLEVIAEGIEKKEQALALQMQNCNHGQGFLFGKPVPKRQFEKMLKQSPSPAVQKII